MSVDTFTRLTTRSDSSSSLESQSGSQCNGWPKQDGNDSSIPQVHTIHDGELSAKKMNTFTHTPFGKAIDQNLVFPAASKKYMDSENSHLKPKKQTQTSFKPLFLMRWSPLIVLLLSSLFLFFIKYDQSYVSKVYSILSKIQGEPSITSGHDHFSYVAIIDAGSTGSRIHVYRFSNNTNTPVDLVNQEAALIPMLIDESFELTRPGLSHKPFIHNFTLGAQSLDPLIQVALSVVPKHLQSSTPLSVKATAGLRLIGENQSIHYLKFIKTYLENNYPFKVEDVEIMNGKDEAVYAWLTTNYLLGKLGNQNFFNESELLSMPHTNSHTAAVFDLGGASTQIVFEPHSHVYTSEFMDKIVDAGHGDHVYDLTLGPRKYRLYQNSHLGYGLMETRKKVHKNIATKFFQSITQGNYLENLENAYLKKEKALLLTNPCIATDMQRLIRVVIDSDLRRLFGELQYVGHSVSQTAQPGNIYTMLEEMGVIEHDGTDVFIKIMMKGPENPVSTQACLSIATEILNLDAECKFHPCSFNGVHQPNITLSFGSTIEGVKNDFEQVFQDEQEQAAENDGIDVIKNDLDEIDRQEENEDLEKSKRGNIHVHHEPPLYIFSYFYDRTFPLGLPPTFPLSEFNTLLSSVCLGPRSWDASHPLYKQDECPVSSSASLLDFNSLPSQTINELSDRPEWCLDLAVMYAMLNKGYGIPDTRQLTIAKKIRGYELGWCLGAAIGILGDLEEEEA